MINHVEFDMSLPAALAAPRVSQTNSATSLAEPAFYNSPTAKLLTAKFGEHFTMATGAYRAARLLPG